MAMVTEKYLRAAATARAVRCDRAAATKLAKALSKKQQTEKAMKAVGKASDRPLIMLVKEATQCLPK
jgi:hypothetical protein